MIRLFTNLIFPAFYLREQAHKISSREAECVLAQTELPEDGIRFDVTITHIEQPDCLFIQRVPPSGADMRLSDDPDPTLETATYELRMLEQMMTKINAPEYFKKYPPLSTASQGEMFVNVCRRVPNGLSLNLILNVCRCTN